MTTDTSDDDRCGYPTADDTPCKNPTSETGGNPERCWIDTHNDETASSPNVDLSVRADAYQRLVETANSDETLTETILRLTNNDTDSDPSPPSDTETDSDPDSDSNTNDDDADADADSEPVITATTDFNETWTTGVDDADENPE